MSRGQPRPRSQSARRILRRCQNKGNIEDAIIIDDDTENADVVLIDDPNTSRQGSKHAKTTRLNCSPGGVIYIDDEGEDPRNSSTDTTTSNQFAETFCSLSLSEDSESDEYPMFVGNGNVCCDHTGPSRNRYGLDLDSEDSMTQSNSLKYNTDECDEFDCSNSDCEIMDDHLGIIREQWEKAASRKKESGQFASTDQANAPGSTIYSEDPSHAPILHNADVAYCFKRTPYNYIDEILAKFGPSSNNAKQSPSANVLPTDENEDFYFKDKANIFVPQSCSSSHIPCEESGTRREDDESNLGEYPQTTHSMNDGLSFINKDAREPVETSLFTYKSHGKTRFFDNEEPSTRTSYDSSTLDGKHVSKDNDLCTDRAEHKLDEVSHNAQAKHVMADKRVASTDQDQANAPDSTIYYEVPFHASTLHNAHVACCFKRTPYNYIDEILAKFGPSSNNAKQSPSANVLPTDENEDFYFKDTANIFFPQSCSNSHIPCEESGTRREDDESNLGEYPQTTHSMDDGLNFINKDAQEPVKASLFTYKSHGKTRFFDNEEPSTRTSYDSSTWDGKHVSKDNDLCTDGAEHKLDEVSHNAQAKHVMADKRVSSNFEESKRRDYEELSPFCSRQHEEPRIKTQSSTICGDVNAKIEKKVNAVSAITDMSLTSHKPDDMPHGYQSLIGERERHKETDEYRQAAEEEWASRQRQLQIQAEEAQRLRKRRKAETMRLLDMEKRQKQRLEEIRDLQKKDEEIIQLKEQIRTEVRKDLEIVEMTCRDMTSVLRALGIHVKGGFSPTVNEINAAYKQALLRFHPDRASRTDIRQQVEAEEKFKLISRLKEKLLM